MNSIDSNFRWIVAQEGSRRNYSIPVAFQRLGSLRLMYTDIWCHGWRSVLAKGPAPTRALAGRFNAEIPREKVISFTPGAIARKTVHRLGKHTTSREHTAHFWCDFGSWFANRISARLERMDLAPDRDVFFGFDTNCLEVIQLLRERKIFSIVNQIDPGQVEEDLVLMESERWPGWENTTDPLPQRYWDRLKQEWDAADLVVVNSKWSRDALMIQGVPAEKLSVAPLAIDLKGRFRLVARDDTSRTLRVLWLGNVILRKGIQYLVGAARSLQKQNIQFLVAGELGINRDILRSFPDNIKVLGPFPRSEAIKLYSKADVFVFPTLSDGFGVTQLEAMSQGLPVISTLNCGRVVTDGVDGFIVPPRDSEALASAIARLHADRELLRAMSRHCLETVKKYDLPSNARMIEGLVQKKSGQTAGSLSWCS